MERQVDLLCNIHIGLNPPCEGEGFIVANKYQYFHYIVDGCDDRGWGCGYRTLQSICSWINMSTECGKQKWKHVPSLREVQELLVKMEDKDSGFVGSKSWIGSFEICLVLEHLFDIQSKIVHIKPGALKKSEVTFLKDHFIKLKAPVMMGGDADSSSKCILGVFYPVETQLNDVYLLVMDPHFVGRNVTKEFLQAEGWVCWKRISDFDQSSFYNFCLPQIKADT